LELNDLNFESFVLGAEGPVLVDFTAEWCPPCRALAPVLERIAKETSGRVSIGSVDADAYPNLSAQYGIRGLPTMIVFVDGKEVARRIGLTTDEGVRKLLGGTERRSRVLDAS
jgi:thioredoxin 1